MTELEKAVGRTIRLTEVSTERLLPDIQRNIAGARAELIRSGVPADVANSDNALVEDCIIAYCMVRMGEASERAWYDESFRYQMDNLRKSTHEE